MDYFISDMHFGHSNVIRLNNRPFKTVEEMNQFMINAWNSKVTDEDTVYILGDVSYRSEVDVVKLLKGLKGKKVLIVGNHDKKNLKNPAFRKCFEEICDMKTIILNNVRVVMCHYPLAEWDGYYREAYHVHGHIHNNTGIRAYEIVKSEPRALNAGVDIIGFAPATFEELIMLNKQFKESH